MQFRAHVVRYRGATYDAEQQSEPHRSWSTFAQKTRASARQSRNADKIKNELVLHKIFTSALPSAVLLAE